MDVTASAVVNGRKCASPAFGYCAEDDDPGGGGDGAETATGEPSLSDVGRGIALQLDTEEGTMDVWRSQGRIFPATELALWGGGTGGYVYGSSQKEEIGWAIGARPIRVFTIII